VAGNNEMNQAAAIQFLIDTLWQGKWPEHQKIYYGNSILCTRCRKCDQAVDTKFTFDVCECHSWNPFESIEDEGMLMKEMVQKRKLALRVYVSKACQYAAFTTLSGEAFQADTITHAALKALGYTEE